jgi:hypothetical protein
MLKQLEAMGKIVLVLIIIGCISIASAATFAIFLDGRQTSTTIQTSSISSTSSNVVSSSSCCSVSTITTTIFEITWTYSLSLNASIVSAGQALLLTGNLTNVSGKNLTVNRIFPSIEYQVFFSNGTEAFSYPSSETQAMTTISAGESIVSTAFVLTSNLTNSQNYPYLISPWHVGSGTLPAGKYLITAGERFQGNGTGYVSSASGEVNFTVT